MGQSQTQLKEFEELKPSPLEVIPTVTDVSATPPRTLIQDSDQAVNPGVLSILDRKILRFHHPIVVVRQVAGLR